MADTPKRPFRNRLDFQVRAVQFDEASGSARFELIPDPRRYEWVTKDDTEYLYDKLDGVFIPRSALRKALEESAGLPINFQPQLIKDAENGARTRWFGVAIMDRRTRESEDWIPFGRRSCN